MPRRLARFAIILTVVLAMSQGGSAIAQCGGSEPQLVTREQVKLNLAGAEIIARAARKQATALRLRVNIAVTDDGGHLITFLRMDGARPASIYTSLTKATTAATLRQATGPLPPGAETPDVWLNISVQNAAAVSGGKFTTLQGGVPVIVDGQVIGAIGVGGGTGEQDAVIAQAGVAAFDAAMTAKSRER